MSERVQSKVSQYQEKLQEREKFEKFNDSSQYTQRYPNLGSASNRKVHLNEPPSSVPLNYNGLDSHAMNYGANLPLDHNRNYYAKQVPQHYNTNDTLVQATPYRNTFNVIPEYNYPHNHTNNRQEPIQSSVGFAHDERTLVNKSPYKPLTERQRNINTHNFSKEEGLIQNKNYDTINTKQNEENLRGILPTDRFNPDEAGLKKKMLQNELKRQIEMKKMQDEAKRRKEIELDLQEEEKFQIYLKKKKEQELLQQQKRKNKFSSNDQEKEKQFEPPKEQNNQYNKQTNEMNLKQDNNIELNFAQKSSTNDEVEKFKNMIGLTYENINKSLNDDLNSQIVNLRSQVSKQYLEMNNMFNKLRMEVQEAAQLKSEAEFDLNKIRDEIENRKLTNLIFEDKFNEMLEKHAPHNNLHIPINEVHPLYKNRSGTKANVNLKATSTMIFNKEEIKNDKRSSLVNVGQSLVGDSEFVPITTHKPTGRKWEEEEREIKTRHTSKKFDPSIDYSKMYSKLEEISQINQKMDPGLKYRTLNKNFEYDMSNAENMSNLDAFLKNIVEKTDNTKYNNVNINNNISRINEESHGVSQGNDLVFPEELVEMEK